MHRFIVSLFYFILLFIGFHFDSYVNAKAIQPEQTEIALEHAPPWMPGSSLRFERYSAEQGLSMSVVNAIAQDLKGFLWFGT